MNDTSMSDTVMGRRAHPPDGRTRAALDDEAEEPPSKQASRAIFVTPPARGVAVHELPTSTFPISPRSDAFRLRYFPEAPPAKWSDWRWQVRNRFRDLKSLERVLVLSESERDAIRARGGPLPLGITPYYASLMSREDANDPIRRTHVPVVAELNRSPGEADDPLGEDHDTAVPGLVHRYPDRVLFLATPFCSTYCRYCTRSRMVGESGEYSFGTSVWRQALDYLREHTEVRDVLISGGDPLVMTDDKLAWLLAEIRAIEHIEFVRIGTKIPVVMPMRITANLAAMLRRYRVWLSIHFTHPDELTAEVASACDRLADSGIPLGSQTVLLKGINDDPIVLRDLFHGLLRNRVRPYYLYQCDPVSGSAHFRTTIERGLELLSTLRGFTTGYAVPTYVVDAPGGGGKIPLIPNPIVGREDDHVLLRNYEGNVHAYPDISGDIGGHTGTEAPARCG